MTLHLIYIIQSLHKYYICVHPDDVIFFNATLFSVFAEFLVEYVQYLIDTFNTHLVGF